MGLRIQTNHTLWNVALPVHVKEGVQLETNGNSLSRLVFSKIMLNKVKLHLNRLG
jgi:hypothetical protein